MADAKQAARKIVDLVDEIKLYQAAKAELKKRIQALEEGFKAGKVSQGQYDKEKVALLKGEPLESWLKRYEDYIQTLWANVESSLDEVDHYFSGREEVISKQVAYNLNKLSKKEKEKLLAELSIEKEYLDEFLVRKKKKKEVVKNVEYALYETSDLGRFANKLFESLTNKVTKQAPEFFAPFYSDLHMSGIKILSKTYISNIFLGMLGAFLVVAFLASAFYKHPFLPLQILRGIMLGVLGAVATGAVLFFYPKSAAGEREKSMKGELPFVIIHMAAVAGSGAKPISIFKTLLATDEYPTLQAEIKKIVNYVNLFGYDLSTALKSVSRTTPSLKFKDLLDGIVNTIETGGDMKEYLAAIADEALTTYKLERQKYVEVIATYSDIYTSLFIAAPLLFFSTLAIIQTLGGQIGGLSVGVIASVGTYLVIPVLNVGFMFFLDTVKPK